MKVLQSLICTAVGYDDPDSVEMYLEKGKIKLEDTDDSGNTSSYSINLNEDGLSPIHLAFRKNNFDPDLVLALM